MADESGVISKKNDNNLVLMSKETSICFNMFIYLKVQNIQFLNVLKMFFSWLCERLGNVTFDQFANIMEM